MKLAGVEVRAYCSFGSFVQTFLSSWNFSQELLGVRVRLLRAYRLRRHKHPAAPLLIGSVHIHVSVKRYLTLRSALPSALRRYTHFEAA